MRIGERMGVLQVIHVAPTMDQAIAEARWGVNEQWDYSTGTRAGIWAKQWWLPHGAELTSRQADQDWFDFLQELDAIWVGTPDYVAEKMETYRRDLGLEHAIIWPQLFGLSHLQVMRSLELFASDVMPRFRL